MPPCPVASSTAPHRAAPHLPSGQLLLPPYTATYSTASTVQLQVQPNLPGSRAFPSNARSFLTTAAPDLRKERRFFNAQPPLKQSPARFCHFNWALRTCNARCDLDSIIAAGPPSPQNPPSSSRRRPQYIDTTTPLSSTSLEKRPSKECSDRNLTSSSTLLPCISRKPDWCPRARTKASQSQLAHSPSHLFFSTTHPRDQPLPFSTTLRPSTPWYRTGAAPDPKQATNAILPGQVWFGREFPAGPAFLFNPNLLLLLSCPPSIWHAVKPPTLFPVFLDDWTAIRTRAVSIPQGPQSVAPPASPTQPRTHYAVRVGGTCRFAETQPFPSVPVYPPCLRARH